MIPQPKQSIKQSARLLAGLLILLPVLGYGQTAISAWTLSNANAANSTAYTPTITFDNQTNTVSSITVGSSVKTIAIIFHSYSNATGMFGDLYKNFFCRCMFQGIGGKLLHNAVNSNSSCLLDNYMLQSYRLIINCQCPALIDISTKFFRRTCFGYPGYLPVFSMLPGGLV